MLNRYLNSIKRFKKVIIILYILLFSLFFGFYIFNYFFSKLSSFSLFKILSSSLMNIKMKPFIISGLNSQGTKYYITSAALDNYIASYFFNENIFVKSPIISIIKNNRNIDISAEEGTFFEDTNIFSIEKDVKIEVADIEVDLDNLKLDFTKDIVYSNRPFTFRSQSIISNISEFSLTNDYNILNLKGPIFINFLDNRSNTLIKTEGNIIGNISQKTFKFQNSLLVDFDGWSLEFGNGNFVLKDLKGQEGFLNNFKRIDAKNIRIENKKENGFLEAKSYIYDNAKKTMVLFSKGKKIRYISDTKDFSIEGRIEYQEDDNIIVARGKNKLISKDQINTGNLNIESDLSYIKLDDNFEDILYLKAFDNIVIYTVDYGVISANFAYIDFASNSMFLEDNIKISYGTSNLYPCRVLINIETGETNFIKCQDQEDFRMEVEKDSIKKE